MKESQNDLVEPLHDAPEIPDYLNRPMSEGGVLFTPPERLPVPWERLLFASLLLAGLVLALLSVFAGATALFVIGLVPFCLLILVAAAFKFLLGR